MKPISISIPTRETITVRPFFAPNQLLHVRCASVEQDSNDEGPIVVAKLELLESALDNNGNKINPGELGSTYTHRIYCYAKEGSKNPTWFHAALAQLLDGLLGTSDKGNLKGLPERPDFNAETVEMLFGRDMFIKLSLTDNTRGGLRNEIVAMIHPSQLNPATS